MMFSLSSDSPADLAFLAPLKVASSSGKSHSASVASTQPSRAPLLTTPPEAPGKSRNRPEQPFWMVRLIFDRLPRNLTPRISTLRFPVWIGSDRRSQTSYNDKTLKTPGKVLFVMRFRGEILLREFSPGHEAARPPGAESAYIARPDQGYGLPQS